MFVIKIQCVYSVGIIVVFLKCLCCVNYYLSFGFYHSLIFLFFLKFKKNPNAFIITICIFNHMACLYFNKTVFYQTKCKVMQNIYFIFSLKKMCLIRLSFAMFTFFLGYWNKFAIFFLMEYFQMPEMQYSFTMEQLTNILYRIIK